MTSLFVITTGTYCFLNFLPVLIKYLIGWIFGETKVECKLKDEMEALKNEMSKIPYVDEFSKYTKLQRKHIALDETYLKEVSKRVSSRAKFQLLSTYLVKILKFVISLTLMMIYEKEPVVILPKGSLYPLENFLSWPGMDNTSISLTIWLAINCIIPAKTYLELFKQSNL